VVFQLIFNLLLLQ